MWANADKYGHRRFVGVRRRLSAFNFGKFDQLQSGLRFAGEPILDYYAATARPRGFVKHNERTLYDHAN